MARQAEVLKGLERVSETILMTVESKACEPFTGRKSLAGTTPGEIWQVGDWLVDPSDDSIRREGETVKLEPRTMRLLLCLAEANGAVVGLDQLLTEVWAGVVVGPASVYQSVSQLRKLLRDTDSPPAYIETVARKGYRLVAPVRRVERRQPAAAPAPAPAVPHRDALPASAATAGAMPPAAALPAGRRWQGWALIAAAVTAVVAIAWMPVMNYLTRAPTPPSLVVLPFVDMTSTKANQPFCDGLTEELSNWLAQLPTLRVVARTSAFAFKDKPTDVRDIGRQLGTTHVLEGSVRRTGDNLRITVQLIDTRNGYHEWSGSYDAPITDVLHVQEDIARAIASTLEIKLLETASEGFSARGSSSAAAYQLYLVAHYHQRLRSREDNERAIELHKQAIAADPDFALAYIGLAYCYLNQQTFENRPVADIAADVEPLLARAENLHPALADIYVVRATLELQLLRQGDALRDLERAVKLNRNSRDAYAQLGLLHLVSGQPREALQDYDSAAALDPLDYYLHAQRCMALQDLARFDQASAACERARALAPQAPWAYSTSSWLADAQGRIDEALRWNAQALKLSPGSADLYADRGKWLLSIGLDQRARATYQQAIEAIPGATGVNSSLLEVDYLTALATEGTRALQRRLAATKVAGASAQTLLDVANAQLLGGNLPAARLLVDRALALGEYQEQVVRNEPWAARHGISYQLIAAYALEKTDASLAAEAQLRNVSQLVDRLIDAGLERHEIYELQAAVATLHGDLDGAMRSLNHAMALGNINAWRAEHEPYLEPLRTRSDYRALIQRVKEQDERLRKKLAASEGAVGSAHAEPAAAAAGSVQTLLIRRPAGRAAPTASIERLQHRIDDAGNLVQMRAA
jgi:transcriptional activator of cad operon